MFDRQRWKLTDKIRFWATCLILSNHSDPPTLRSVYMNLLKSIECNVAILEIEMYPSLRTKLLSLNWLKFSLNIEVLLHIRYAQDIEIVLFCEIPFRIWQILLILFTVLDPWDLLRSFYGFSSLGSIIL